MNLRQQRNKLILRDYIFTLSPKYLDSPDLSARAAIGILGLRDPHQSESAASRRARFSAGHIERTS